MRKINSIIVHCSGTPIFTSFNSIRNYHVYKLGWKDIGYHYVIDEFGNCLEGRPADGAGAHCKGHNDTSIGICLIGGRDRFDFTFDQLLTLVGRLRYLSVKYSIPKDMIFSHYDFNKNKNCPQFCVQNLIKYEKGFYKKDS